MREFDVDRHRQIPNMYLIDIQSDQKHGVEGLIQDQTGEKAELVPTIRARIYAVNGTPVNLDELTTKRAGSVSD